MMNQTLTKPATTSNDLGSVNLRFLGNARLNDVLELFDVHGYARCVIAADAEMAASFECFECRAELIYIGARKPGELVKSFMCCPTCGRGMAI